MTGDPPPAGGSGRCAGHPGLTSDFRAVAMSALDRLGPVLDRVRAGPTVPTAAPTCAVCPVCALIAVLRGERPELAVRLADHAAGLLVVLRAALDEGDPAAARAAAGPATEAPPPPGRVVQRIPVDRVVT